MFAPVPPRRNLVSVRHVITARLGQMVDKWAPMDDTSAPDIIRVQIYCRTCLNTVAWVIMEEL